MMGGGGTEEEKRNKENNQSEEMGDNEEVKGIEKRKDIQSPLE